MSNVCPPIPLLDRLAVTIGEAADLFSCSPRTIARMVAAGKLSGCAAGGARVTVASLKALRGQQPMAVVVKRDRVSSPRGCFVRAHVMRKAAR